MSATLPRSENGCDAIGHARFKRACTEQMDVEKIAPHMWEVTHGDSAYITDLRQAVVNVLTINIEM